MRESFENVKVGDVVIERSRWRIALAKVTKVTATQVVIGENRYRKKDGYLVGSTGRWYPSRISLPKEGEIEELRAQKFIEGVVLRLNKLKAQDVTYEQAVKIKEVLGL